jgi:hypothetical protein
MLCPCCRAEWAATDWQRAAAERAFSVRWVQKPQDGSADALLDVMLMPSYVFYSPATVDSVVAFFAVPQVSGPDWQAVLLPCRLV